MRFHLNSIVSCAFVLAATTALNASEVRVWGDTTLASPGVFAVPAGLNNAVAVSASFNHVLALRDTGAVVAWGDNSQGQCNVPVAALSNVTAISAAYLFSFALKNDGSVVGWGDNTRHVLDIPAGLPPVRSLHVQPGAVLVVLTDNTLRMWGDWAYQPPAGLMVTDAYPMTDFGGAAIKGDGTIVQWLDPTYFPFPAVPSGLIATTLANNSSSNATISSGGTVSQWGYNTAPQTNLPAGLTGVVEVAIGGGFTIARKSDGTLVTWGRDANVPGIAPSTSWTNAIALSGSDSFTAGVFAIGNPPTSLALTPQSIHYGTAVGTAVGTLSASDPDSGSTFTYELVDGTGSANNALFSISGSNLITASSITPIQDSLSIRVFARDQTGNSKSAIFLLTVTDRPSDSSRKCGLGGSGIILLGCMLFGWLRRRPGNTL